MGLTGVIRRKGWILTMRSDWIPGEKKSLLIFSYGICIFMSETFSKFNHPKYPEVTYF